MKNLQQPLILFATYVCTAYKIC